MAKPKQRQLAAKPASKSSAPSGYIDYLKLKSEEDLLGEDGWVIVKKQRVTILVPSLHVAKNPALQKLPPNQSQIEPTDLMNTGPESPREVVDSQSMKVVDTPPESPVKTHPSIALVDAQEKGTLLDSRRGSQIVRKAPDQHVSRAAKSLRQDSRIEPQNHDRVDTVKLQNMHRRSNASKSIKRPRLIYGPRLLDGNFSLNQRLRASNLERKLEKAGGLSRWLASIGLGQFVRIFQGKNISKFQLVNLTMEKLKDMGAVAVGPRRKLIHAINCLCQPYCFGAP